MNEQPAEPLRGEPIKKRLNEIHEASGCELSLEREPISQESLKREIYALSALLMETCHRQAMTSLHNSPERILDGMQQSLQQNVREGGSMTEYQNKLSLMEAMKAVRVKDHLIGVNEEELQRLDDRAVGDFYMDRHGLSGIYTNAFQSILEDEAFSLDDVQSAAFIRLESILLESQFRATKLNDRTAIQTVESFLQRGANTAAAETWGIVMGAILKYRRETGKEMTKEQLQSLEKDFQKCLNQVASWHIKDFSDFQNARKYQAQGPENSFISHKDKSRILGWEPFLKLSDQGDTLRLALDEELVRAFQECMVQTTIGDPYEELQHGCPAITARGEKTNLIADVTKFYMGLAEQVVLPYQERLVKCIEPK